MDVNNITEEEFFERTGHHSQDDDLERANYSKAGQIGHRSCGWCSDHNLPRFMCGCLLYKDDEK